MMPKVSYCGYKTTNIKHDCRVCYLARARAMARVVLAQIEFTRAICGSRKILSMLQYNVIFLHSKRKMHEITAADSGLYIVIIQVIEVIIQTTTYLENRQSYR